MLILLRLLLTCALIIQVYAEGSGNQYIVTIQVHLYPGGYTRTRKKDTYRLPRCVQQANKKKTLLLKDYSEL